ncbi:hypothetical protein MBM_09753 [Drepanopeziza brunnea f. sp. 'multigermtubi' MB_m1]|uniref:Uncharacterized protein n=1 Tax=Marssonina brunnea f. sp. multigermtubi (strain MB_m1) TaxID=1072389 RepID=K1WH13_MARBU|nr:uncharacterized protein MBM_09753 [Drepanopeziza brunnea f. sp. 'multigermtubi' MB_m1]EKD12116.1 hypothetical protein MBM_09753 [Drepanopeziza brunnea f. sp. 'multigermtubi' MB_m1]
MTDKKGTKEISKEIEATDLGFGNELLKDLKRRRITGNYIGNPLPIKLLAKHSTLAYGTLSAFNDDNDDFFKLRAADLYLRAKELTLFARSFFKELKYSRLDDDFKTQLKIFVNQVSRYGLTSDDYLAAFFIMLTKEAITFYYNYVIKAKLPIFKANAIASLADKLYLACKNVLETIIARMNLAFTFTAAIADIRKAIAFATKTFRLLVKAKAYASFNELYDHTCS